MDTCELVSIISRENLVGRGRGGRRRKRGGKQEKQEDKDEKEGWRGEEGEMTRSRMRRSFLWLGDGDKATPDKNLLPFPDLNMEMLKTLGKETRVLAHLVCLCMGHFLIPMSLQLVAMQEGSPMGLIVHSLWNSLSITEINFSPCLKAGTTLKPLKAISPLIPLQTDTSLFTLQWKSCFFMCYQGFLSFPLTLCLLWGGFCDPLHASGPCVRTPTSLPKYEVCDRVKMMSYIHHHHYFICLFDKILFFSSCWLRTYYVVV